MAKKGNIGTNEGVISVGLENGYYAFTFLNFEKDHVETTTVGGEERTNKYDAFNAQYIRIEGDDEEAIIEKFKKIKDDSEEWSSEQWFGARPLARGIKSLRSEQTKVYGKNFLVKFSSRLLNPEEPASAKNYRVKTYKEINVL